MSSSHVNALSAPAAFLLGAIAVLVTRCAAVPGATAHRQTEPGPPRSPPGLTVPPCLAVVHWATFGPMPDTCMA
jgi:hypothetical protein